MSLSPADLTTVTGVERLVLPSPNGSSICFGLAEGGAEVVGACLRNRSAVARHLYHATTLAVVAAGERWPDGSLRPCVEPDLPAQLSACAGGLELAELGFGADVAVAAELDVTDVVPVLGKDAAFRSR